MSESESDLQDAVDLAIIADDEDQVDVLLADLLIGGRDDGARDELFPLTEAEYDSDTVESVVLFLENRGLVAPDGSIRDRDACIQLFYDARRAIRAIRAAESERLEAEFELVATLPGADSRFDELDPADFDMRAIPSALLQLSREASDSLLVVSPFLESSGVDWLLPGVKSALQRGVDVTVVSRELTVGKPNLEAIEELSQLATGEAGKLRIFDYYEGQSDTDKPLYTLHSKVVVADDAAAYLGSANFTRYGFSENLELGAVLRGEPISSLKRLFDYLVEGATEVKSV